MQEESVELQPNLRVVMIRVLSYISLQSPDSLKYKAYENIYDGTYENDICIAEFVRNICVNLNIDPGTSGGFSQNVRIKVGVFFSCGIELQQLHKLSTSTSQTVRANRSGTTFDIYRIDELNPASTLQQLADYCHVSNRGARCRNTYCIVLNVEPI